VSNTSKKCDACGETKDRSSFSNGRKTCVSCKQKQFEKRASGSYEKFCRALHSGAKYSHKKRAALSGKAFTLTAEEVIELWEQQNGRCALSGTVLTHHRDGSGHKEHNASLDRKDPSIGYTIKNVQLVCYRVNIMKHALTEDMFYWWTKTITDYSCD